MVYQCSVTMNRQENSQATSLKFFFTYSIFPFYYIFPGFDEFRILPKEIFSNFVLLIF